MTVATTYRTCPRSGLQFEAQAEKLMMANAFVAVVYPVIGFALFAWASRGDALELVYPLVAGFALVGPIAALGPYEIKTLLVPDGGGPVLTLNLTELETLGEA